MTEHPAAAIFELDEASLPDLIESVRQLGQVKPILTWQNQIVDGRRRWRACQALGLTPRTEEWSGQGSLVELVIALNLHRRHLTVSQRALAAVRALPLLEAEARQRQRAGLTGARPPVAANLQQRENLEKKGRSAAQAARTMQVSERSVHHAAKVAEQGAPALVEAVQRGQVAVSAAAKLADLPPEQQVAAMNEEGRTARRANRQAGVAAGRDALAAELDACRAALARIGRRLGRARGKADAVGLPQTARALRKAQQVLAEEAERVLAAG